MQNNLQTAIIMVMDSAEGKDKFAIAREAMVRLQLAGRDITDARVLEVMGSLPREAFLSTEYQDSAYNDNPLPIGSNQTISQPYIVALMTQCLRVNPDCEVLEIGTGSGYQAAILAKLAKKVYTIERFEQLSNSARGVLERLGIKNVEYYVGDGSCGWPSAKQFDRIIITAAVPEPPSPLVGQLADGGIMLAPEGSAVMQDLIMFTKKNNVLSGRFVCGCRFVKLVGKYAFNQ